MDYAKLTDEQLREYIEEFRHEYENNQLSPAAEATYEGLLAEANNRFNTAD